MHRFNHQTVLITGASAGIGAALAQQFASEGADLVLIARRLDRLEAVAAPLRTMGRTVHTCEGDVTQAMALTHIVNEFTTNGVKINIVIANAGSGVVGNLEQLSSDDYRRQFETNVFGVLNTIYATLPELRRTQGQLVLMGSVAGYASLPGASAYSMSKFALRALAESLRSELASQGMGITLISSGFVDSDIRRTDNSGRLHADAQDPLPAWVRVSTSRAARIIVNATFHRRREQMVGVHGRLIVCLARHFPWLLRLVAGAGLKARSAPHP